MSTRLNLADNSEVTIRKMFPGSGYTGTFTQYVTIVVGSNNPTSTATATPAFINPEQGRILARATWEWIVAGTGTFDMGIGTNGTGTAKDLVDSGTLAIGVISKSAWAGSGLDSDGWVVLGSGNATTANSIICRVTDGVASTADGRFLVQYVRLD